MLTAEADVLLRDTFEGRIGSVLVTGEIQGFESFCNYDRLSRTTGPGSSENPLDCHTYSLNIYYGILGSTRRMFHGECNVGG